MGLVEKDDGWRMPDAVWAKLEPLLPPGLLIHWSATTREYPTGWP